MYEKKRPSIFFIDFEVLFGKASSDRVLYGSVKIFYQNRQKIGFLGRSFGDYRKPKIRLISGLRPPYLQEIKKYDIPA